MGDIATVKGARAQDTVHALSASADLPLSVSTASHALERTEERLRECGAIVLGGPAITALCWAR